MYHKIFWIAPVMVLLGGELKALSPADKFITTHCGDSCNGESNECSDCQNRGLELYDQLNPVSPEIKFDIVDKYGKLELEF